MGSLTSSCTWTTSGPGIWKRKAMMAMTPAKTQITTAASSRAAIR